MMNYVKLGNICEIARGGSPRPINDYLTNDNNGINWIKIGDTSSDSKYIEHTEQKIKPEGVKKSRYVKVGDFILSNSMSFGRPYILKIDGCIHDGWLVLQNIDSKLDKDYLYTVLSSPYAYHQFEKMAVGGVVNNLNSDKVKELIIPLPSLEKQKRIAKVLEECNSIIIKHKKLLEKYDKLIKSRFIEMFGEPVINSKNWQIKSIGDSCFVTKLAGFEYSKYIHYSDTGDGVMLKSQNVKNGKLNNKELSYISNEVSDSLPRSQLAKNDVVMTYVGANIGDVAVIDDKYKYHLAPNVAKIRPNVNIYNSDFLVQLLMMLRNYIVGNSADTAKAAIGMEKIRQLQLPIPPITLQNEFASFIKQIDKSKFEIWLTLKNYGIIGKRVFLYDQF